MSAVGRQFPLAFAAALAATLLALPGCARGDATSSPVTPPPAPAYDVAQWVGASDGTLPVVIVAPHGGTFAPDSLPMRNCAGCVTSADLNTQALAEEVALAFERRIGQRPFVVVNRLHRSRFDGNRPLAEATDGFTALNPLWDHWMASIDSARARALRVHARAILLDLHGHGHPIPRVELGYNISASQLRLGDDGLLAAMSASSIARLHQLKPMGDSGAMLVRGPRSLGARLAALGVPAVPSDSTSAPLADEAYFSGGYISERFGSADGGAMDAIQLELHYTGVRDTAPNRTAFAEALVTATLGLLADYYGWTPPAP